MTAHVVGWGKFIPSQVLSNDDLAQMVDTSDEWIRTRTGIGERHVAADGETTSTMALQAARQALEVAGLNPAQLELVIVATVTPDYPFPSTGGLSEIVSGIDTEAVFFISKGPIVIFLAQLIYHFGQVRIVVKIGN